MGTWMGIGRQQEQEFQMEAVRECDPQTCIFLNKNSHLILKQSGLKSQNTLWLMRKYWKTSLAKHDDCQVKKDQILW